MRALKQPLIIAYILTGIVISPFFLSAIGESETILNFSHFGVAFLLFIVGLHLNPRVIKEVGFTSLIIGSIQIIFTAAASFALSFYLLNFALLPSLYICFALTFSSTIIITKILSDKRDLDSLYGKITVGILILQDLVVIALLILLSYFSQGTGGAIPTNNIIYAGASILGLFLASIFVLPSITKFIAKNQELLFLFAIGWCFLLASLFFQLGFSMEIGALLAGMSLAISPYHTEISAKVKPLRDFFLIIFFILLGLQIDLSNLSNILQIAIILSIFVILFKLFIVLISMGIAGHKRRTSFFSAISLGQISEFSFIIVALGVTLGHILPEISSIIVLTGLITIASSTYLMDYLPQIYNILSKPLKFFERKNAKEDKIPKKEFDLLLLGYNRIGFSILKSFKKLRKKYLVVDFNPETVKYLKSEGIPCIYGDAEDTEFLRDLNISSAELIISTIPELEGGLLLLDKVRKRSKKTTVILTSHNIDDTFEFYKQGADYVIMPHFLGGEYTAKLIETLNTDRENYKQEREKQIQTLRKRKQIGHEHPSVEKNHS
ncbi:MAG: cation:proton antiporter [Nanoarchaeota archaeon]|nr:cation:proton antiporter [Nanoarchaeota archaeon]